MSLEGKPFPPLLTVALQCSVKVIALQLFVYHSLNLNLLKLKSY